MAWLLLWIIALRDSERRATEATDWMKPAQWTGNYWGPTATRARSAGRAVWLALVQKRLTPGVSHH